ncbi:hypothetical protein TWF132_012087 [Orbilia oligospora]|nr:hypothetical protein TWF132_012087 [Orbilia oligospora]KAF3278649.1 hypothetical protein TWF132_012087 [Orbilia oligospora]
MIPEPTETELSFLTWHHPSSGIFINPVTLEQRCPLDNGRLKRCTFSNCGTSSNQLGAFSSIPVEISYLILEILDVQSLTECRAINWYFRSLVDEVFPYKSIVKDCPEVLRALLSTKSAPNFTIKQIYKHYARKPVLNADNLPRFWTYSRVVGIASLVSSSPLMYAPSQNRHWKNDLVVAFHRKLSYLSQESTPK